MTSVSSPKLTLGSLLLPIALTCGTGAWPVSATGQIIVAHRGASHDAPENTLAAFQLAWQQDADAIEGDFWLSGDGEIVCMHDSTTKRTADVDLQVADTSLATLRQLDVGRWKDRRFAGQQVLTLPQVLALVPPKKSIFIEVKCGPEIVPALATTLKTYGVSPQQAIIISFQEDVIAAVKRELPQYRAYWVVSFRVAKDSGEWTPGIDRIISTASRIGADGVDVSAKPPLTRDFVRRCRDAGLSVHAWTVDDPTQANELSALGVESITTNRPAVVRRELNGAPQTQPVTVTTGTTGSPPSGSPAMFRQSDHAGK